MSNGREEERNKRFKKKRIENLILQKSGGTISQNELDSFQDMVQNKLEVGMGELFNTAPKILQRTLRKMPPPPTPGRRSNTKAVLDSKGKPVKNLRQAAKQGGQFEEVDVMDLTTEMVIDE
tara:strand:- start:1157 stop:1519 length:363 start_codon:yes stop_codon:yes gene_type:complete